MSMPKAVVPKAVVFDLDGCLWYPDMYMLWGGGAPFERAADSKDLVDRRGARVKMLGDVPQILLELKTDPKWADVVVAVASCTDEPDWAQECLQKFEIGEGFCMKDVMQVEEIYKGNKRGHLRNISERTGIALDEMLFLDNEWGNTVDVSSIGVTVAYVPDGVTRMAWERVLAAFPAPGETIYGSN